MRLYLDSVVGLLQERTAEELIVGVFLALILAVGGAGVHVLARRKVKDTVTLLTVVCLIANLVAMISTAGYIRMKLRSNGFWVNGVAARPPYTRAQIRDLTFDSTARAILQAADLDRDGKLSADEAATASALFVQTTEAEIGQPVDSGILASMMRHRVRIFESRFSGDPPSAPDGTPGHPLPSRELGPPDHLPVAPRR